MHFFLRLKFADHWDSLDCAVVVDEYYGRIMAIVKSLLGTVVLVGCTLFSVRCAQSAEIMLPGLKIQSIRAVGQYNPSQQFNDTLEMWFTTPLVFPAGSNCIETRRVIISAKNYHLVAAAYLAFTKGRTVNVAVDDTLPIRAGSCEVTYMDVMPQ